MRSLVSHDSLNYKQTKNLAEEVAIDLAAAQASLAKAPPLSCVKEHFAFIRAQAKANRRIAAGVRALSAQRRQMSYEAKLSAMGVFNRLND